MQVSREVPLNALDVEVKSLDILGSKAGQKEVAY